MDIAPTNWIDPPDSVGVADTVAVAAIAVAVAAIAVGCTLLRKDAPAVVGVLGGVLVSTIGVLVGTIGVLVGTTGGGLLGTIGVLVGTTGVLVGAGAGVLVDVLDGTLVGGGGLVPIAARLPAAPVPWQSCGMPGLSGPIVKLSVGQSCAMVSGLGPS